MMDSVTVEKGKTVISDDIQTYICWIRNRVYYWHMV